MTCFDQHLVVIAAGLVVAKVNVFEYVVGFMSRLDGEMNGGRIFTGQDVNCTPRHDIRRVQSKRAQARREEEGGFGCVAFVPWRRSAKSFPFE
jgi:hypothetical protein